MKCESCEKEKPDVYERVNAFAVEMGNNPDATHIVCGECDYQNRMDI